MRIRERILDYVNQVVATWLGPVLFFSLLFEEVSTIEYRVLHYNNLLKL